MAKFALADPVFEKAVKALSEEAQHNLVEIGLSDPGVLDAYLWDLGTELEELAWELGDVVKLVEVWAQAKRAARGQRTEFARRGLDQFARWNKVRKVSAREHEEQGPNELQRAAEAPPPWHCRRLPSRWRETAEPGRKKRKGSAGWLKSPSSCSLCPARPPRIRQQEQPIRDCQPHACAPK